MLSVEEQQNGAAWPAYLRVAGEAYGVPVLISTDTPEAFAQLQELLPPAWEPHDATAVSRQVEAARKRELEVARDPGSQVATNNGDGKGRIPHFTLISHDGLEYVLRCDDAVLARSGLDVTLGVLDSQLRGFIALHSPGRIFVHAGVVGLHGRAILIPGPSFSGKSTLVAELVRAGAVYYSDEYAVLDDRGLIHPYPKPLSIRTTSWSAEDHHVSTLGGSVGTEPLPLGLVVVAQYSSGATWEPHPLSPGQALLALLANTVPAQERPEETMTALRTLIGRVGIVALEGDRGEAADMVQQLLERVPA